MVVVISAPNVHLPEKSRSRSLPHATSPPESLKRLSRPALPSGLTALTFTSPDNT